MPLVRVDILIPVYREGESFLPILGMIERDVRVPYRVLICYDDESDPTLEAIRRFQPRFPLILVKNEGRGAHGAVMTGFRKSDADALIVYPADDDRNTGILDTLVSKFTEGYDIVAPSRFMKGGCMVGCRWIKATLVRLAAFTLYHIARVPTHDATNGFRLFSARVVRAIPVESTAGFAFSIELLVKTHRKGWKVAEVPASWFERKHGASRFRVFKWLPVYLRWYFFAFATIFVGRECFIGSAARVCLRLSLTASFAIEPAEGFPDCSVLLTGIQTLVLCFFASETAS